MATSSREIPSDVYTCSFPGCPAPVSIHISLVETLQGIVRDTSGDQQGILYGQPGAVGTVVQSSRALTVFGKDELRRAIAEAHDPVVGYYRIREGKRLELTPGEINLAATFCSDPRSVILLILRRAGRPEANFFFLEHGFLNLPLLEFPLSSAELTQREAPPIRRMNEQVGVAAFPEFPPPTSGATSPSPAADEKPAPSWRQVTRLSALPIGVFVALVCLCAVLFLYRPNNRIGNQEATSSTPHEGGISLRAEWRGEDLEISWDTNSPATSGVLEINDGGTTREIPITGDRVQFGNLLYSPVSERISVRLTNTVKDHQSTAQMSVLLKRPPQPQSSPVSVTMNAPLHSAPIQGRQSPNIPFEVKTESRTATRPFVPPTGKRDTKLPVELEDLPAVQANLERFDTHSTLPLSPVAQSPAVATLRSEATKPPEEDYVAPVLIAQGGLRTPRELLPILRQSLAISVRVDVNQAGRVTRVEAIAERGIHALLLKAATDAAWLCRFQPARRGQSAVSSSVTIVFHIGPEKK